jgi:hypothetical protein
MPTTRLRDLDEAPVEEMPGAFMVVDRADYFGVKKITPETLLAYLQSIKPTVVEFLDDLEDTVVYLPIAGEVLSFDGTSWVNRQLTVQDIGDLQAILDTVVLSESPALTGTPTTPTAPPLSNNLQIANTAYVDSAIAAQPAGTTYTDEQAQDAVGIILTDSTSINFTYSDATPSITAAAIFGTASGTVCQGNDARLSDARALLSGSTVPTHRFTAQTAKTASYTLAATDSGTLIPMNVASGVVTVPAHATLLAGFACQLFAVQAFTVSRSGFTSTSVPANSYVNVFTANGGCYCSPAAVATAMGT